MIPQEIKLISFGGFDSLFLNRIKDSVKKEFRSNIKIIEGHFDLTDYYEPARRQYNADKILNKMDALYAVETFKIIGLFNVDIFIPIFTYIFGQAFLNGRSGIASVYRLTNERYGIKPDNNLLMERFSKEIIHELGHTFGLIHCKIPDCVMRSGTYVEDIDQKKSAFCENCKKEIDARITPPKIQIV
jgi:archaemetzincin